PGRETARGSRGFGATARGLGSVGGGVRDRRGARLAHHASTRDGPAAGRARAGWSSLEIVEVAIVRDVLFGLLMAVGLVGVIVPVLPGLMLIGGVAVVWGFAEGSGAAWAVVAAMIVILAVGTYLKFQIPGR